MVAYACNISYSGRQEDQENHGSMAAWEKVGETPFQSIISVWRHVLMISVTREAIGSMITV
jgi:hypothetical protein